MASAAFLPRAQAGSTQEERARKPKGCATALACMPPKCQCHETQRKDEEAFQIKGD